jgi:hypothetical protein
MKDKDALSKGPKRRDPTCYQTQRDIVIPAGTILRAHGNNSFFCLLEGGEFVIDEQAALARTIFKRVIA